MLGLSLNSKKNESKTNGDDGDVLKLFFDSFSKRVGGVEEGLRSIAGEVKHLKVSQDRFQISDLVLLERLQRAEEVLEESLHWIKHIADIVSSEARPTRRVPATSVPVLGQEPEAVLKAPLKTGTVVGPTGETGSLPSITTPTELQVLSLLAERGPMSAPEVGKAVGRSREHSARLMKKLFEEGYVRRDQTRIPFRYSLVDRVLRSFRKAESKGEGQETVTVPQT